jgi:NADPH2:quinone reductase
MRAVHVRRPGGFDALELVELPAPAPAAGEVVVRVAAASVNWGDTQKRQAIYPDAVSYPAVLGMEVSGVVDRLGKGVPTRWLGQRVAGLCGPRLLGGYAEEVSIPVEYLLPLPKTMAWSDAAAFALASLTAYHLLRSAADTRRGDVVLVHAAGGSVGLALIQIARILGARVLGTVGSAAKGEVPLRLGAERIVDRSREDFVDAAMEATGGRGVDLVIDSLGGEILPRSFDALRTYGRVINIGEASGEPDFAVRKKLYERSTSLAGFEVLHARPGSARWRRGVRFVLASVAAGRLSIPVGMVRPLEGVAELHRALESRGTTGKAVALVADLP